MHAIHSPEIRNTFRLTAFALASTLLLNGCAALQSPATAPRAASPAAALKQCSDLAANLAYPGMAVTAVEKIAANQLTRPGITDPIPEHCVIQGKLNERTSPVDGKVYAIGFEMRLPTQWNGRFFYQANGGLDGVLAPAFGEILGGGPRSNALTKGFAVISSDAGHLLDKTTPIGGGTFGLDPQARRDYGYNAVAQLTPMAKAIIGHYYGKRPDTSYIVGTSNGGRHAMMAAARDSGEYDGVLASAPGFNLPRAAVTQLWDAQQFARVAQKDAKSNRPDLETSFTPADLAQVSRSVLARCDALDGLQDGIVADTMACLRQFDVERDIPGLSAAQKATLAAVFAGPKTSDGKPFYVGKAWDAGIAGKDWRNWKFVNSVGPRDAVSVAFVFSTPPQSPAVVDGKGNSLIDFALGFDLNRDGPKIFAKNAVYTESAEDFMVPPDITGMEKFVARGGKLIVAHGVADPVFSAMDTVNWYQGFKARHGAATDHSTRLYLVPGMNHSRNGPATDQFDLVEALVNWVEKGQAPQAIVASARGPGSNLPNPEIPANWAANRTRLLCPFPTVAQYRGSGSSEEAASFGCVMRN